MQKRDDALIFAAVLDGRGGARELDWDDLPEWTPADGVLWVHFHLDEPRAQEWLAKKSGLNPLVCDALLVEDTRPRAVSIDDGLLMMLRGVNLNPGAEPEDMVSIRLWIESNRIVSVRRRRLMAVQDILDALATGRGPSRSADFLLQLTDSMTTRIGPVIGELHERLSGIEEEVLERREASLRVRLSEIRRQLIRLRRFLAPQRETLMQLSAENRSWWTMADRMAIRETAFALTRHVEDLDVAREQAIIAHDELTAYVSERLGQTMYVLALVTTFFLPITFITGLLGMNVGGVPGAPAEKFPNAFLITVLIMAVILGIQAWLFRRLRLMK